MSINSLSKFNMGTNSIEVNRLEFVSILKVNFNHAVEKGTDAWLVSIFFLFDQKSSLEATESSYLMKWDIYVSISSVSDCCILNAAQTHLYYFRRNDFTSVEYHGYAFTIEMIKTVTENGARILRNRFYHCIQWMYIIFTRAVQQ